MHASVTLPACALKYLLIQVNSSVFPTGGHAHSFGMEHYINRGEVHDGATVHDYLRAYLYHQVLYSQALPLRLAHEQAVQQNVPGLLALDQRVSCSATAQESRQASHLMAESFVQAVASLGIELPCTVYQRYLQAGLERAVSPNHAVAYGVFSQAVGFDLDDALAFYLYASIEALVGVAVKTIPLGQKAGQRVTTRLLCCIDDLLQATRVAESDQLCLATPGFALASMRHEVDPSRLYMS